MSVDEWFREFHNELTIKNRDSIAIRYKRITKRLNLDFWNSASDSTHSLYVGSYGRCTAAEPFSDLDMLFVLPPDVFLQYDDYKSNGQSALLQAVKRSIEGTYPTTNVGADGQVIQVPFSDGITFEVVPAFKLKDGDFAYPNANNGGSWKFTNPVPEMVSLSKRNDESNGNLYRISRMLRAWRSKWSVPIGGLLIDTLAYQFLGNYTHKNKSYHYYDWIFRDLFQWLGEIDSDQSYWHAPGSRQVINGKGYFQAKARKCAQHISDAIDHEQASPSRTFSAKMQWREVFGNQFPS